MDDCEGIDSESIEKYIETVALFMYLFRTLIIIHVFLLFYCNVHASISCIFILDKMIFFLDFWTLNKMHEFDVF